MIGHTTQPVFDLEEISWIPVSKFLLFYLKNELERPRCLKQNTKVYSDHYQLNDLKNVKTDRQQIKRNYSVFF